MSRFIGLHTLPGFTREMLERTTPALEQVQDARFVRAYSSFNDGKVVCEFEAPDKATLAQVYGTLGFPYDQIVEVEAICDAGEEGVRTRFL
jgi:hypothetical protein